MLNVFSTKNFTYVDHDSGLGGTFVIERSTLNALGGLERCGVGMGQLGLILQSAKTGNVAEFRLDDEPELNADGDIVAWTLRPTMSSYRAPGNSSLEHVVIKVYNT